MINLIRIPGMKKNLRLMKNKL